MPHIVIEHSNELSDAAQGVMQAVHAHVSGCGLFSPQAVKARSMAYSHELLPEGARNFMHITLAILDGRSEGERASLSADVFALAKGNAPEADRLSVDVREMCAQTYTK